jgi:hypothetical protein
MLSLVPVSHHWRYTFPNFSSIVGMLPVTQYDGVRFSYRVFLNLLYGLVTTSFQSGFKLEKQEKGSWG